MSDKPPRPKGPRMSHLYSEPIPMSFASPQQLAQLAAAPPGSLFMQPQMKTPNQQYMPMMHSGYNMDTNYQMPPVQPVTTVTTAPAAAAAAAPSLSGSTGQTALKPLPPQEIDASTFKGFKFITLDAFQIETREVYDKISGTYQWEMCESQEDRCIKCVRDDCKNKRVFIVTSGALGSKIVPEIHEFPQVYAIYIYCANVKYHSEWSKKFPKVRVVCDNDDLHLLPLFAVDVAQSNIDWGDALLKQGQREKAHEKYKLAYDKLTTYARHHDEEMDSSLKKKIEESK
jgi:hypothetical protein